MPTLVNTIDSKELYAARAVADAAGNDIAQTYATKAELPVQAQADWDQTVTTAVDFIKNKPTIVNYVAGTNITFTETGAGTEISATGGGSSVNADWDAVSGPEEILNKPTPKTLTAGPNITVSETASTITIGANVPAPTPQVNADWDATSGVAEILNKPTVDQSYDGTSTNAQSGTAVADAIGNLPTNLSAAQLLALKEALGVDETVLYSGLKTVDDGGSATYNLSELPTNFQKLKVYCCASDNTFPTSQNGNCGIAYFEWDTTEYTPPNTFIPVLMNGGTGTSFTQYWTAANVNGIRTTSWTVQGSLNSATTNAKWFHIYKIVGVHRIASN